MSLINQIDSEREFAFMYDIIDKNGDEKEQFFYHSNHLGSSSWITDINGDVNQHLQNLPFGETFIDQRRTGHDVRFKFTGKERDSETGFDYFGARYYNSNLSIWLSVDPLSNSMNVGFIPSLGQISKVAGMYLPIKPLSKITANVVMALNMQRVNPLFRKTHHVNVHRRAWGTDGGYTLQARFREFELKPIGDRSFVLKWWHGKL